MGLPGAGKTTLAESLRECLWYEGRTVSWFNADLVRQQHNDWDFSTAGRIRQSQRMQQCAANATTDYVICDFVAALPEQRDLFDADWIVWVDTVSQGRYADTNPDFVDPDHYDFRVTEQDSQRWAETIAEHVVANQHTAGSRHQSQAIST